MSLVKRLGMRALPYGANYLDWADMTELKDAIDQGILFRYQTETESFATRLERHVSRRFEVRNSLGLHNCSEALRLAIISTSPRVGDLVFIPAVTFVAVAGAVLACGLIPVLVDVDENLSLDASLLPNEAERVIVAHMEGTIAPLPSGVRWVIEDAAQAMGGRFPTGEAVGTKGYAGVFSFHHAKVLTSGEGGLLITQDDEAWARMRKYHDHGSSRVPGAYPQWDADAYYGENLVTSEAIAAIQLQQFRHLDAVLTGLEQHYAFAVGEQPVRDGIRFIPRAAGDVKISVRYEFEDPEMRDKAVRALTAEDIPSWTLNKYFLPDHPVVRDRRSIYADGFPWNLAAGAGHVSADDFQTTRARLDRLLCLPLSPELPREEQAAAVSRFRRVIESV